MLGEKGLGKGLSTSSLRSSKGGETMSLAEQIAAHLADRIVKGSCEPGARVHEMAVSAQFKVSRGPVREALRILEKEGLITILPRRGAVVTNLTIEEVRDVFEIRSVLLGLAARRAALARDEDFANRMRAGIRNLESLAQSPDEESLDAYVAAVQELAFMMTTSTGSDRLASMLSSLFHQIVRYSRLGLSTHQRRAQSVETWQTILRAIEEGDADTAEATARTLIENSKNQAMKMLLAAQKN